MSFLLCFPGWSLELFTLGSISISWLISYMLQKMRFKGSAEFMEGYGVGVRSKSLLDKHSPVHTHPYWNRGRNLMGLLFILSLNQSWRPQKDTIIHSLILFFFNVTKCSLCARPDWCCEQEQNHFWLLYEDQSASEGSDDEFLGPKFQVKHIHMCMSEICLICIPLDADFKGA